MSASSKSTYIPYPGSGEPCAHVFADGARCGLTALPPRKSEGYPIHTPPGPGDRTSEADWRLVGGHEYLAPTPTTCLVCHEGEHPKGGEWKHPVCPRDGACLTVSHGIRHIEEDDAANPFRAPDYFDGDWGGDR